MTVIYIKAKSGNLMLLCFFFTFILSIYRDHFPRHYVIMNGSVVDYFYYYQSQTDILKTEANASIDFALGVTYHLGLFGNSQDDEKAMFYFRKAADSGMEDVKEYLSFMYFNGFGCIANKTKAMELTSERNIFGEKYICFIDENSSSCDEEFNSTVKKLDIIEKSDFEYYYFQNKLDGKNSCADIFFSNKMNISLLLNSTDPMCYYVLSKYYKIIDNSIKSEYYFNKSLQAEFPLAIIKANKLKDNRKLYKLLKKEKLMPVKMAKMKFKGIGTKPNCLKSLEILDEYSQNNGFITNMKKDAEDALINRDFTQAYKIYCYLAYLGNLESIKKALLLSTYLNIKNKLLEDVMDKIYPSFDYKSIMEFHKMMSSTNYENLIALAVNSYKNYTLAKLYIEKSIELNNGIFNLAKFIQKCILVVNFFWNVITFNYFLKLYQNSKTIITYCLLFYSLFILIKLRTEYVIKHKTV